MKTETKKGNDWSISENEQLRAWLGSGNGNGDRIVSRNMEMK